MSDLTWEGTLKNSRSAGLAYSNFMKYYQKSYPDSLKNQSSAITLVRLYRANNLGADVTSTKINQTTSKTNTTLVNKILSIAFAEEGYKGKGADGDTTKYGAEMGAQGSAWCTTFVAWCFKQANASALLPRGLYVPDWIKSFNKQGKLFFTKDKTPIPGDLMFYLWPGKSEPSHVAFVVNYRSDGTFKDIGGNVTGSIVKAKERTPDVVYAFARPDYGSIL